MKDTLSPQFLQKLTELQLDVKKFLKEYKKYYKQQ